MLYYCYDCVLTTQKHNIYFQIDKDTANFDAIITSENDKIGIKLE